MLSNERVHLPVARHDVAAMNRELEAHGIQPLMNCAYHLKENGVDLWLAGIDDLWEGKPDLAVALEQIPAGAASILLAHNPDIWQDAGLETVDLVLSGHVHGGQVRLPILGAVHTQGAHVPRRHAAGWFERGRTRMFVTRGLGESLPIRFGARPQVALITLRSSHGQASAPHP